MTTAVSACAGLALMRSTTANPSTSGMRTSRIMSGKDIPVASACSRWDSAALPPSAVVGLMPQRLRTSAKIRRLVALSSTTSTGTPCNLGGGMRIILAAGLCPERMRAVK